MTGQARYRLCPVCHTQFIPADHRSCDTCKTGYNQTTEKKHP